MTEEVHHLIDTSIKDEIGSPGDTDKPITIESSTNGALEFPLPRTADNGEVGARAGPKATDEKEEVENDHCEVESSGGRHGDTTDETDSHVTVTLPSSHTAPLAAEEEIGGVTAEVSREVSGCPVELPQIYVTGDREGDEDEGEGEEKKVGEEIEGINGEGKEGEEIGSQIEITVRKEVRDLITERKDSDENQREGPMEGGGERTANEEREEKAQEAGEVRDSAACEMSREIWDEVEEVVCEMIEYEESKNAEKTDVREEMVTEGAAEERDATGDVVQVREEEEEMGGREKEVEKEGVLSEDMKVPEEGIREEEEEEELMIKTEVKTVVVAEELKTPLNKEKDREIQRDSEIKDVHLAKESELDDGDEKGDTEVLEKNATEKVERMADHQQDREERDSKELGQEDGEKKRAKEQPRALPSTDEKEDKLKETDIKELREGKCAESGSRQRSDTGLGRVLVISKQAAFKVYQVKAVPVVPPKPQHCRLTALSLRQQQQQQQGREWRDADREKENLVKVAAERNKNKEKEMEAETGRDKVCVGEQGTHGEGEDESSGKKERWPFKGGEWEKRRDGDEGGIRDMKRDSPISMCFDEAVAMATMKRGREKENSERERQRERGFEVQ